MKLALQRIYYPTLLALALTAFILFKDHFTPQTLPTLTYIIGFSGVVLVFLSEILMPYRKEWNKNHGDFWTDLVFTNLILPSLSKLAEIILGYFFVSHASDFVQQNVHTLWPSNWPLLIQLVLILLIAEFFFYWVHRFGHTIAFLWRFHSVHHSPIRVYWNNSGRFHPIDLLLNWIIYFAPLFILGCPHDVIAAFLVTNTITGLLEHANVDFKAGWLNYLFNTAELHRWHHSINWNKANSNYGKVLCVWDIVFGTYYRPPNEEVGQVGIENCKVPSDFFKSLLHPFQSE